MSIKRVVAAAVLLPFLSSCYAMVLDIPDPSIQPGQHSVRPVRTIEQEERGWFLISGLLPLNKPDLSTLQRQLRADERLGRVRVKSETTLLDGTIIVLGSLLTSALGYAVGGASAGSLMGTLFMLLMPTSRTMAVEADVVPADAVTSNP